MTFRLKQCLQYLVLVLAIFSAKVGAEYIVNFEESADFDAVTALLEEDGHVATVRRMEALRMAVVTFGSDMTTNQKLEFLRGFDGVKDVEESQPFHEDSTWEGGSRL